MTETDDFKVEPWKPGELRFKIWHTALVFTHAEARAIAKALLAEAGEESDKTCATCAFCDQMSEDGHWFCNNLKVPIVGAIDNDFVSPQSFVCPLWWEPAPDSRANAEGEQK